MKKITYLLLLFFTYLSYGQTCEEVFEVEGDDDTPMVLTVNASDLDCAVGTINSITITDAILDDYWAYIFGDTYCNEYYSFELNIDGVISSVCAEDLIGMVITDFTTLTITSADIDDDADTVYMGVLIEVAYTATDAPDCTTVTGPLTESENALNGILTWESVVGAVGYKVSVGTATGQADVLDSYDAGNVTTYNLPGVLTGDVEYFVTVTPYNSVGDATGCVEYSFVAPVPPVGSTCANPIEVTLPFSETGDTLDHFDTIYEGSPGATGCGTTSNYLNGNDIVYSYTADFTGSIKILLTPETDNTWGGLFVYGSCSDIGVSCLGGVSGSNADPKMIEEFEVVNGETYYIVISTWATPQTIAYTLDITKNTCSNGAATYAVVSDCANGQQFLVNVDVTDLGTATSMTISDNQGSAPQAVAAAGIFTFGPYPNATPVIFTVSNDQDESCFLTSPTLNQTVCPPSNDTCATAIDLADQTSPLMSTTVGATNTNLLVCNNSGESVANTHSDVYYSILVPNGATLEIGVTLSNYDTANVVFYGDCDNRTNIACYDDPNYTKVEWSNNTGSDQTVYWVQDGWSGNGTFTLEWLVYACTPAEATYTVVSDCANGEQFLVEVEITALGSATSISVSDDQDSASQVVTQLGTVTFGPYPNDTPVIFTVANDQDEDCVLTSPVLNQIACPPANDECASAITLTAGGVFDDFVIETTNVGATVNPDDHDPTTVASTCDTYNFFVNGKDVWYTVLAPASGTLTIETASNEDEALTDTALYAYTGACSDLTYIKCSSDIGGGNNFSKVVLTDLTPGEVITARVWGYSGASGAFKISAYDASLANVKFDNEMFKAYPNPVKDLLNLSYTQNISNVEIFNMLGQQVFAKTVNATQGQVDMSNLAAGTYLVKVATDNQVKTIKVIKQ